MALSITELELQSAEYLPAREVMTSWGGNHTVHGPECNTYYGGIANGANVQDVLSDINVGDVQVGPANLGVTDLKAVTDIVTTANAAL